MRARRYERAPGCVAVGAGARMPVERADRLQSRRRGRAPGRGLHSSTCQLNPSCFCACIDLQACTCVKSCSDCSEKWTNVSLWHLAVLQSAQANDCTWSEDICELAVTQGHLEILRWAGAYTRPLFSSSCAVSDTKCTLHISQDTPQYPLTPPNTSQTPSKQPLNAPPIPQKALSLSRKVDECKPLAVGA